MATPTVTVEHAAQSPSTEGTHDAAGATVQYRIEIVLGGTNANVAADWATLIATNFASPSALISWQRA